MDRSEIWGSFSVIDHRRSRAFVAETLIYDRLIIPHPPSGDGEEYGRWRRNKWRPDHQRALFDVLGEQDLAIEIPWVEELRKDWEEVYSKKDDKEKGVERSSKFHQLQGDVDLFKSLTPKDAPYLATAGLLGLCVNNDVNHPIVKKIVALLRTSDRPIEPVMAYRTYRQAKIEQNIKDTSSSDDVEEDESYHLFGWQVFVPEDEDKSEVDLLRDAVKFATRQDVQELRQSFNGWVKRMSEAGVEPEEARRELTRLTTEHHKLQNGTWRNAAVRWVARLAPVAAPAANLLDPFTAVGAGAAAAALPIAVEKLAPKVETPDRFKPVVYVNQSKRFFGRRWLRP